MSTSKQSTAAAIRAESHRSGGVLRRAAKNKAEARRLASDLSLEYPADKYGITFKALDLPGTTDWAVYGFATPLLERGEVMTEDHAKELARRVKAWDLVLLRQFQSSGAARTTSHRDKTDLLERFPILADLGVTFRSQAIGYGGRSAQAHGEYALIPKPSVAAANLQESAQ